LGRAVPVAASSPELENRGGEVGGAAWQRERGASGGDVGQEIAGRLCGAPEAAGLNCGGRNPWRWRSARTPVELEVEDECRDWFAKTEKFRGLIVK